jgi:hypothetical protein
VAVAQARTNQPARPIPAQSRGLAAAGARPTDLRPAPHPVRDARPAGEPTRPPGRRRAVDAPRILNPVACDHRRAPIPLSMVFVLAVMVCLAVVGLAILANAGAGTPDVPERTAVVRVQPGESLTELAHRVAPNSDPAAVVDRIRELNDLPGSQVRPGQPLTVPAEG